MVHSPIRLGKPFLTRCVREDVAYAALMLYPVTCDAQCDDAPFLDVTDATVRYRFTEILNDVIGPEWLRVWIAGPPQLVS